MRAIFVALALLAAPLMGQTADMAIPEGAYEGDPTHTSVTFKISHFGLSFYTARFASVSSKALLDVEKPEASSVEVEIDARSVRTDFPFPDKTDFDKEIGTDPRFLDGDAHPVIRFVSKKIVLTGKDTADVMGDLTLRGVTKPVVLKARLNGAVMSHPLRKVPMFGISANATISRKDFGLTIYEGALGDEVTVLIETEYAKAGA
jgi:polyisoprenoid-binding protein YceI